MAAVSKVDLSGFEPLLKRLASQYGQRDGDINFFAVPARLKVSDDDLSFMVFQLLDNALKFSSPNTRVNVNTVVDSEFYVISVADQGQGMIEEQISRLGPFIQLNLLFPVVSATGSLTEGKV